MIELYRSGSWYRLHYGDKSLDVSDNPSMELIGQSTGSSAEFTRIVKKISRRSSQIKGDWYLVDEGYVDELEGLFIRSGGSSSSVDIRRRYSSDDRNSSSWRIVWIYDQMRSLWLSSGGSVESLWESRLLGHYESLKSVGSGVFSCGSFGEVLFHDGRLWVPVSDSEVRVSLQYFCLNELGIGAAEWIRHERQFLSALYDGARLNPLRLSRSVVGFQNGVYDFSDVTKAVFHPFSERLPVVELLPYDYIVGSRCPKWEAFLSSILSAPQVELLQKFFGLGLVDRRSMPYKVESSLWLVGPGGAGKSTIMDVVMYVLGEGAFSSISLGGLLDGGAENRARFLATAVGKVFNYCGEIQVSDMTRNADSFKSLCSGEPQSIRRIGGNVETAYDIPYLVFNMNKKPKNTAIDSALRRRMLFITFRTAVRECDRDPMLRDKLKKEASGIRNWMLEGYRKFVAGGGVLVATDDSLSETEQWMAENGQTVDLYMSRGGIRPYAYTGEDEKGEWVLLKDVYDGYFAWCGKNGYDCDYDVRGFGRELRAIGYDSRRNSKGMQYKIFRDKK